MTLADDGTQELKFSIPMYCYDPNINQLVENPIWYTTRNGNLMINMRKLKVIFNKQTYDEEVFEFVITQITESHDGDVLTCEVTSEGLAFHELGKTGYKYSLSLDTYELDFQNWQESTDPNKGPMPKQNVQYWCAQIDLPQFPSIDSLIDPNKWYYEIKMDWSTFVQASARVSNIVYEEMFVSAWNNDLVPTATELMREKERTVTIEESNRYNITQEIAKQFGIFCRYEYLYDTNYHIVGKKIVFFNNFLHDKDIFGLTYPYSSKSVSRSLDSTDIITKMYVRSMEDTSTLLGEANITYCTANKTLEDYILNFDYLYETGGITEEQYEEIPKYEKAIRAINSELIPLEDTINALNNQKTDLEAKIVTYTNSIKIDQEQVNQNSALKQELVFNYGSNQESNYLDVYNNMHPDPALIIQDAQGNYYINLNTHKKGIQTSTVRIYRTYSSLNHILSDEITTFSFEYDVYGNPVRIYGVSPNATTGSSQVYLTYTYEPYLYYDAIVKTWTEKLGNDQKALENNNALLNNTEEPYGVNTLLENAEARYDELIAEKKAIIQRFNEIMGPALREGYWQPEDYQNYGEQHRHTETMPETFNTRLSTTNTEDSFMVGWDDNLFDEEQDIYYTSTINETHVYYPCINISSIYQNIKNLMYQYSNVAVIFNNNYINPPASQSEAFSNIKNIRSFVIGSEAILGFISSSNTIYPALILTGAKNMNDNELAHMRGPNGYISIGVVTTNITNKNVLVNVSNQIPIQNDSYWQFNGYTYTQNSFGSHCKAVYPRIKFSSLMLKTDTNNLYIRYEDELLSEFEDYYINTRTFEARDYKPEYLITLKPYVLVRNGTFQGDITVDYNLSNASTSIYLDALEITKENAYPKVSYNVSPNILNTNITRTLYKRLNWLVMINDVQLQLHEAYGYISKLDLDLDAPQNDVIEVKNYTNKFEDLFSTILAQTDSMRKNENILGSLTSGTYVLPPDGLMRTLDGNNQIMLNYLASNFLTSDVMNDYLSSIFTEVSSILSDSNHALGETSALTLQNSQILSNFTQQVQNEMVPRIYRQTDRPLEFKIGDMWIETEWDSVNRQEVEVARYIATSDSKNAIPGYGWTRTYGGSHAQIIGAALNIDTVDGNIDVLAPNNINIAAGNTVDIHANEIVNIVGDKVVNIGGTQINIGSTSDLATDFGGINIVAAGYNSENFTGLVRAKVLINPGKIYMFGNEIDMVSGTPGQGGSIGTSAVKISGQNGIWLGSTAGITLFSGSSDLDNPGGSNVQLMPTYLLFGVSDGTNGTAVKLTKDYFVLGAGASATENIATGSITGITGGLTGLKITKDSFGLAMITSGSSGNVLNAVIMNNNGITLGSGVTGISDLGGSLTGASGSYVRISGTGIILSSNSDLYVNTNNVLIDTSATGTNPMFQLGNALSYSATNGLNVTGRITANELYIMENNTAQEATAWVNAKVTPEVIWLKVKQRTSSSWSSSDPNEGVTSLQLDDNGITIASGGSFNVNTGTININTSNLIVNSAATGTNSIFELRKANNGSYTTALKYSIDDGLEVSGKITSTSGNIGGWSIGTNSLSSGNVTLASSGSYAIDCNGNFTVDSDGNVWLRSLYVSGQYIDFTTAFNNAVSLWGTWSGTTFNVSAQFYGNSALTKTESLSASVAVSSVTIPSANYAYGYGTGTVELILTVGGSSSGTFTETVSGAICNAVGVADNAWDSAANAVSYTPGDIEIWVPIVGGGAAWASGGGGRNNLSIEATYNAGYNQAINDMPAITLYEYDRMLTGYNSGDAVCPECGATVHWGGDYSYPGYTPVTAYTKPPSK